MKKKKLLLSSLLMLMSIGMAHGQTNAYVYVQQSGSVVGDDGIATVDISSTDYELSFSDDGSTAYMKVGNVTVATLPINSTSNGELVANTALPSGYTSETAVVKASVTTAGYATYYSPFRLSVPASDDVKAYAPTYDSDSHVLACTDATNVNGKIIPASTALLLKGSTSEAKSITMTLSASGTAEAQGALSGTALQIATSSVRPTEGTNALYTLGYEKTATTTLGFFELSSSVSNLNPAKAYLIATRINTGSESSRNFISFDFDGETTSISDLSSHVSSLKEGKFLENGRVVIVKNGRKYNVNGQEVR